MKLRVYHWGTVLFLPFVTLFLPFSASKCSYRPPTRNQVLPPVSLDSGHVVKKRSVTDHWEPLRVAIYYHEPSLLTLSSKQQVLIKETILPGAVKFWSETLRVLRSTAPIRLHRKCQSNEAGEYKVHYPFPNNTNIFYCDQGCETETVCGDVPVPDEHLLQCLYLSTARRTIFPSIVVSTKQASGPPDGQGVADADFVLYVSTLETDRCNVSKTVAYAAHCQQEMTSDRPIAGHANLCPHSISDSPADIETILSTVKHEMLHALGFSVALFAFYRDAETGLPRTPRDRYGRPPWSSTGNTYQWSKNTIQEINRSHWKVRKGSINRVMHMLVTPKVVEESRNHFSCNNLEGAELEDQGGEGTVLTHWEKRVFENEAMTGVHTQNPVYSRITLALLEDSGWYKPDYAAAGELSYGKGMGCDFAMKSCKSWIDAARKAEKPAHPFCDAPKTTANNMIKTECSASRSALSICNLSPFSQPLLPEYQHFNSIPGVAAADVPYYGGSVDLADFCPFMQEFSWKGNGGTVRGARCSVPDNQPDGSVNFALEKYGPSSTCFAQDKPWSERTCLMTRTWLHWGSGCYEHSCKDGRLHAIVSNRSFICMEEGQRVRLEILGNEWLHSGTVICPACNKVCEGPERNFTCLPDVPGFKDPSEEEKWDSLSCNLASDIPTLSPVIFLVIATMTSMVISLLPTFI